ncbi:MAG: aldehyde dehydrogenase family protein, partial [Hyphomicrobiales bacterium]|nr:aldehyde dehydrogenase family protein [Hyphomicrobiales bacterium]
MTELSKARVHNLASAIKPISQAFIDGKFCDSATGDTFETINPATGAVVASIAHCGAEDVDRSVTAARRVFEAGTWSRAAPEDRKAVLLRLA